jgi:hypothetical protein
VTAGTDENEAQARYSSLVEMFLRLPDVTQEGTGFGSSALKIHGKIFAFLSSRSELVVKLPAARVQSLIQSGEGERFDPGHGRKMREWLALNGESQQDWVSLAHEALEFVGSSSKRKSG